MRYVFARLVIAAGCILLFFFYIYIIVCLFKSCIYWILFVVAFFGLLMVLFKWRSRRWRRRQAGSREWRKSCGVRRDMRVEPSNRTSSLSRCAAAASWRLCGLPSLVQSINGYRFISYRLSANVSCILYECMHVYVCVYVYVCARRICDAFCSKLFSVNYC